MGMVNASITIRNLNDTLKADMGFIKENNVRQITEEAVVDTGVATLVINEELRQKLGLDILDERPAMLANGQEEIVKIASFVQIQWKDRTFALQPAVVSSGREILLGAFPLEGMDLIVDPVRQELRGAHGDKIQYYLLKAS